MDKSWMTEPRHSKQYLEGVDRFLDLAFNSGSASGEQITCPCYDCDNRFSYSRDEVRAHLVCRGIIKQYTLWRFHGETIDEAPSIALAPSFDDLINEQFDMEVESECEPSKQDPEFEEGNAIENGHSDKDHASNVVEDIMSSAARRQLEDENFQEVQAPKQSGRVRALGLGPAFLAWSSERDDMTKTMQLLNTKVETLNELIAERVIQIDEMREMMVTRSAEADIQFKEMKKTMEEVMRKNPELLKMKTKMVAMREKEDNEMEESPP